MKNSLNIGTTVQIKAAISLERNKIFAYNFKFNYYWYFHKRTIIDLHKPSI